MILNTILDGYKVSGMVDPPRPQVFTNRLGTNLDNSA